MVENGRMTTEIFVFIHSVTLKFSCNKICVVNGSKESQRLGDSTWNSVSGMYRNDGLFYDQFSGTSAQNLSNYSLGGGGAVRYKHITGQWRPLSSNPGSVIVFLSGLGQVSLLLCLSFSVCL